MKHLTVKDKNQRKLLLAIPVLALPFLLLLFWALGGGHSLNAQPHLDSKGGLNTELPDPNISPGNTDKLVVYQQAAADAAALQRQTLDDPYYNEAPLTDTNMPPVDAAHEWEGYPASGDPNIDGVNARLAKLYAQIQEPPLSQEMSPPGQDFDQVQAMLASMGAGDGQDPEMAQLDGMLEKILDIQNPGRAAEKIRQQSLKNHKQVYTVSAKPKGQVVHLLNRKNAPGKPSGRSAYTGLPIDEPNTFYDWSEAAGEQEDGANTAGAIVQQTVTVVSGATIKLRLTDDVYIRGTRIPRGTFVYGTCALSGDRLNISLNSIRYHQSLFPVNLIAYDMDGVAGIYMPGAISRDVAKNSAQDAVQGIDYYGVDNSLTAQAAGVGLQAAKSLLSKKAKLIKVTVKAGYRILLKDAYTND
jgi:conjugative transposon TraM protein